MCGIEQVIEEQLYSKEESNQQTHAACLDIGDKLAERVLIEYQDVSKVTSKFVNELGGEYSMYKTMYKEKEKGYGICANNNPSWGGGCNITGCFVTHGRGYGVPGSL